jgi:hypothetical protein
VGSAAAGSQAQAAWRLYVCRSQLLVQHSADLVPWWLNGIALPGTALPCRRGRFNAVMFWYKLHLYGDVYLSTGPEAVAGGGWAGGWVGLAWVQSAAGALAARCYQRRFHIAS